MPLRLAPALPLPRLPWNCTFRIVTMSVAPAATLIPNPFDDPITEATPPPPSMVIDLVMVTVPKPPGSNASISPPAAVFAMAPAKVMHGDVRLHGLLSSPTPDTQVRVA